MPSDRPRDDGATDSSDDRLREARRQKEGANLGQNGRLTRDVEEDFVNWTEPNGPRN